MRRRLKYAALAVVVLAVAAQFIRPNRTNPPINATRTIESHLGAVSQVGSILDRSCGDCHSNRTEWRWYTQVAPVSWVMARAVADGRRVVNFSEWGGYTPGERLALLELSCESATAGRMPGPYAWIRRDTRLSAEDVSLICAAARRDR